MAPAIASITSVNEVRAIDLREISSSVRTSARGELGLTDQTACRTSLRNAAEPVRGLRMANAWVRRRDIFSPQKSFCSMGQYTTLGGFFWTPSSYSSFTTPMISCHSFLGLSRMRLPIAAPALCQYSRAVFSDTNTTGLKLYISVQLISRPASNEFPMVANRPGPMNLNRRTGGI